MSRDSSESQKNGGRILLVDDEENVLLALRQVLTRRGHEVVAVDSGSAAMAQIEQGGHFDVMLTDIRMPGVDGIELAKRVRRDRPELDVVVMTGYASVETAVEAIKLGADDYLLKPFPDIEVVAATVERLMTRRRLEAELARATERLRASQESFASIVERTQDGILVVDTAGSVRFANSAVERLLGRTREELVGHWIGSSISAGGLTEIEFQSDLGDRGTAEVRVEPTEWHGEPASLVMLRDITARKQGAWPPSSRRGWSRTTLLASISSASWVPASGAASSPAGCWI
jgi:CheY-like chemotaxis protein